MESKKSLLDAGKHANNIGLEDDMENIDLAVLAQLVTAVVAAGFALVKSITALVSAIKKGRK